jgi:outer membrane protein TolC
MVTLSGTAQVPLTFGSFLKTVRTEHPVALQALSNEDLGKFQYRAAQGNFDPFLESSYDNKYFNGTEYYSSGGVELKQPLFTSHYLKAGYEYGQGLYLNPENTTPAGGLPFLGIETNLLQGLTFDKRRAELLKARQYVDYYSANQKIQLNELLFSAANSYADYIYRQERTRLLNNFTNLAETRLAGIRELALSGERAAVDTVEALMFARGRTLDLQTSEVELVKAQNQLRYFLQNSGNQAGELISNDSLKAISEGLSALLGAVAVERNENPLLEKYRAQAGLMQTEARLQKELIKPVFRVSYNLLATNDENLYGSLNNYKWGATFSLPLFLRKPVNDFRFARQIAENSNLELQNKSAELSFKRSNLLQSIVIISEQIRTAEQNVVFGRQLVEAEKIKFSNGESSLFVLNSRENSWLDAELKLLSYRLKLIQTFFELIYVDGNLKYESSL